MQIGLLPRLTDIEKEQMGRYLAGLLDEPRLSETAGNRLPIPGGQLALYVDGQAKVVHRAAWQIGDGFIYIGQDNRNGNALPLLDRLGVIAGIIAACGLWTDQMVGKFGETVGRVMLQSYNEAMHGLLTVQGSTPATGLAFSADRQQVAALMGEHYYLPNGQEVEVDETWVTVR